MDDNDKKEKELFWEKHLPNLADKKRKELAGSGGSVRMRMGLFYTREGFERMKKKALKKKLP